MTALTHPQQVLDLTEAFAGDAWLRIYVQGAHYPVTFTPHAVVPPVLGVQAVLLWAEGAWTEAGETWRRRLTGEPHEEDRD